MKKPHQSKAPQNGEPVSSENKKRRYQPNGMRRQRRVTPAKPRPIIAFDFETTRIRKGTPKPVYLTAHGENPAFSFDGPLDSMEHLARILEIRFLTDELNGVSFVAWNSNNFDTYFVAAALLTNDRYILRPYLTRGNALRGLRVIPKADEFLEGKDQRRWEFLDGIAMLGLAGVSLDKFLKNFAPEHHKMTGVIDWEKEEFDPKNKKHCEYAYRDSEGLYHGMTKAASIMLENFNQPLGVTMGGACIKIFKAHIPEDVFVKNLPAEDLRIVREFVMRGGFCYCARRYQGPVWKYDLNQAYAAAMRETELPCGAALSSINSAHEFAAVYIARVTAMNPKNKIPFYYRHVVNSRIKADFAITEIFDTWLTSIEIKQLMSEGWAVKFADCVYWSESFNMKEYVDRLEGVRTTCEGGPSGAIGTMTKATGNHSYGKSVEQNEAIEYLLARDQPEGYSPWYGDALEPIEHVWYRFTEQSAKDYHQPHIGAFITAHVRMKVRRAALVAPSAWIYADTDCVVFTKDVTKKLDIDPMRYGAWKIEDSGTEYLFIAKKVYQNLETKAGHAKGLNVKRLTSDDFMNWFAGVPPVQDQVQRNNFVKTMLGAEMYRHQRRTGTRVEATI